MRMEKVSGCYYSYTEGLFPLYSVLCYCSSRSDPQDDMANGRCFTRMQSSGTCRQVSASTGGPQILLTQRGRGCEVRTLGCRGAQITVDHSVFISCRPPHCSVRCDSVFEYLGATMEFMSGVQATSPTFLGERQLPFFQEGDHVCIYAV